MTIERIREIAELAVAYLDEHNLLDDFNEDRYVDLTEEEKEYFGVYENEEPEPPKNDNPCWNCGYHWQDPDSDFETCHYEGPHQWAPCEAADEEDRRRRDEEAYRREIREYEAENEDYDY